MWSQNALTKRLNLNWPILQAPMGDLTTPGLAAAVSDAGGLGGLGMWGFSGEEAERRVAGFRQLSGGSLNVNYPLWDHPSDLTNTAQPMRRALQELYDQEELGEVPTPAGSAGLVSDDHLAMLKKMKPEVVSFHFGLPDQPIIQAIRQIGIFILSSATTVAEAKDLENRGVDAVIAQGIEAGGHRGTYSGVDISMQPGLFALVPQVADAVTIPVIAAGGIADGRTIAAALMLGAQGVQLGTAFLRCEEANVLDKHRDALRHASESSTVVSDVISGRPARFIKNRLVEHLASSQTEPAAFPAQMALTDPLANTGKKQLTALYAGQSAALGRDLSAADLMSKLVEETIASLQALSPATTR